MEGNGQGATEDSVCLLPELRLRILSLLPPNDLALSGRLSWKKAAQHFTEPQHRTARLSLPLPCHVLLTQAYMESAAGAMQQLTFQQKLNMPGWAATSSCEANVEFALQLLQPHVFPELLHTAHYRNLPWFHTRMDLPYRTPDVGFPAVASGLARLLPSLEQRCPGLMDPGRTLQAAARHCDLAGLQAAWEVLGQRLRAEIQQVEEPSPGQFREGWLRQVHGIWRRIMAAAAASSTPDALAKMAWALDKGHAYGDTRAPVQHADVCGAAAASGDLARLAWLRDRSFPWGTMDTLAAVVFRADLGFIQRLEQEGGYLPPVGDQAWSSDYVAGHAACAVVDSTAKLQWLAGRLSRPPMPHHLVEAAVRKPQGNIQALQLLMDQQHSESTHPPGADLAAPQPRQGASVLTWHQFTEAFELGDLPLLRWLLEAGCPQHDNWDNRLSVALEYWPNSTPAEGEQLAEALQLLVAAGWPVPVADVSWHPLTKAAEHCHPWAVWRAFPPEHARGVPYRAAERAAAAGCHATLEALLLWLGQTTDARAWRSMVDSWYVDAARNGDLGTLAYLRRLGLPMGEGVVQRAAALKAPLPALQWMADQ